MSPLGLWLKPLRLKARTRHASAQELVSQEYDGSVSTTGNVIARHHTIEWDWLQWTSWDPTSSVVEDHDAGRDDDIEPTSSLASSSESAMRCTAWRMTYCTTPELQPLPLDGDHDVETLDSLSSHAASCQTSSSSSTESTSRKRKTLVRRMSTTPTSPASPASSSLGHSSFFSAEGKIETTFDDRGHKVLASRRRYSREDYPLTPPAPVHRNLDYFGIGNDDDSNSDGDSFEPNEDSSPKADTESVFAQSPDEEPPVHVTVSRNTTSKASLSKSTYSRCHHCGSFLDPFSTSMSDLLQPTLEPPSSNLPAPDVTNRRLRRVSATDDLKYAKAMAFVRGSLVLTIANPDPPDAF